MSYVSIQIWILSQVISKEEILVKLLSQNAALHDSVALYLLSICWKSLHPFWAMFFTVQQPFQEKIHVHIEGQLKVIQPLNIE